MEILTIIPARGGSKGIAHKNIKKLAGKPLIEHTIKIAKKSKLINRIIVSTDSEKIAIISKKAGAEIPFLRPKKLAADKSPAIDYVSHALRFLKNKENYEPNIVIILQPTSPNRKVKTINDSIKLLINSKATSVISVTKAKRHPFLSFFNSEEYLKPLKKDFGKYYQRQIFPEMVYLSGSVYTFWSTNIKKYNSIYGPRIKPLIVDQEDSLDIDDRFDFFLNEMRMKKWDSYKREKFDM